MRVVLIASAPPPALALSAWRGWVTNDARSDARFADGAVVLLADQDRSLWDAEQITAGRVQPDRALALAGGGP